MSILGDVLWLAFAGTFCATKKIGNALSPNVLTPREAFWQYEREKYIDKGIEPSLDLYKESEIRYKIESEIWASTGVYPKQYDPRVSRAVAEKCRSEGFLCYAEWKIHRNNSLRSSRIYPNMYTVFDPEIHF